MQHRKHLICIAWEEVNLCHFYRRFAFLSHLKIFFELCNGNRKITLCAFHRNTMATHEEEPVAILECKSEEETAGPRKEVGGQHNVSHAW